MPLSKTELEDRVMRLRPLLDNLLDCAYRKLALTKPLPARSRVRLITAMQHEAFQMAEPEEGIHDNLKLELWETMEQLHQWTRFEELHQGLHAKEFRCRIEVSPGIDYTLNDRRFLKSLRIGCD